MHASCAAAHQLVAVVVHDTELRREGPEHGVSDDDEAVAARGTTIRFSRVARLKTRPEFFVR